MNTGKHRFRVPTSGIGCVCLCLLLLFSALGFGCTGKPNQANIELRKQLRERDVRIADLDRRHAADQATIRSLQSPGGSTRPSLTADQAEFLYTVHGISLGRLTGGAELDANAPGDDAIKVYVVPTDNAGDKLKAAGAFVVELFDLQRASETRIGRWYFPVERARQNWFGDALLYTYVLTCPWQEQRPAKSELTLKVAFTDQLTQREFAVQKVIAVKTAAATSAAAGGR